MQPSVPARPGGSKAYQPIRASLHLSQPKSCPKE